MALIEKEWGKVKAQTSWSTQTVPRHLRTPVLALHLHLPVLLPVASAGVIEPSSSFFSQSSNLPPPNLISPSHATISFSILYFNAGSVLPKLDELKVLCSVHNPDFICICETWLNPEICDSEISMLDYNIIRLDRNRHGGGILLTIGPPFPVMFCSVVHLVLNFSLFL